MSESRKLSREEELGTEVELPEEAEAEFEAFDGEEESEGKGDDRALSEKEERKQRAKEEYRQRMMLQEQQVLESRKKEAERAARNEKLAAEGKEVKERPAKNPNKVGFFTKAWRKIKEVFGELKRVTWAGPQKVLKGTMVVMAVVVVFLAVTIFMDWGLGALHKWFIGNI